MESTLSTATVESRNVSFMNTAFWPLCNVMQKQGFTLDIYLWFFPVHCYSAVSHTTSLNSCAASTAYKVTKKQSSSHLWHEYKHGKDKSAKAALSPGRLQARVLHAHWTAALQSNCACMPFESSWCNSDEWRFNSIPPKARKIKWKIKRA